MTGNNRDFKGRSRGGGDRGGSDRGHRWNGGRGRIYRGRGRGRGRGGGHPPGPGTGCFREKRPGGFSVGPRLVETDVGITEFISQHAGFSAVIKHRFSDFHVNEIDCDGNLVKLTTLDVPAEVPVEEDESSVERHKLIPPDIWEKLILLTKKEIIGPPEEVLGTVPTSTSASKDGKKSSENFHMNSDAENPGCPQVQSTANLTKACPETESNVECSNFKETGDTDRVEIDVTSLDKDSRRAIHMCIKKAFRDVISNTIEKDGKKSVVIRLKQGANCDRNQKKWPTSRDGEYLHFVVHKRNMDTTETVNSISYKLGLKPGNVTFAGTKDRRGITSQLMSIRKGEPSRLFSISKRIPNVFIGNYCFKKKPLRLGDLNGNQFRIALRNVDGSSEEIKAGLESLRINGFINYYGLQRFGTNFSVPTHSIGKALLLGLWQQAVDLILEPRDGFGNLRAALEEWKLKKDANKALQKLTGRTNCIEESLLKGLAALGPNDLVNALLTIPLNTRLLYLHAYQSFIWNQSVSYRIRESGLKPVIGDLVFIESGRKSFTKDLTIIADGSDATDSAEQDLEKVDSKQEVKYLTQENVGDYRMEDIVLPLPGYNVTYPNNKVGSYMLDLLTKDELTPEKFQVISSKQFSLGGTYRHIMARAENLSFKIVHYSDNETDLILSDLDELLKGKDPPQKDEGGKHTALILTMSLEPSTYATMALREITKEDTSATTQTSISAAAISVFDGETSSHRAEVKETNLELIKKNEGMSIPLQESKEVEGETLTVADNTPVITIEGDESTTAENVAVLKRKGDELSEENVAGKKMKDNL